jgi:phospholipase C
MACFNHSSLPVLSSLALEYALFDHWYASVPGPTFPNRLYAMSATSHGFGSNSILQTVLGAL